MLKKIKKRRWNSAPKFH